MTGSSLMNNKKPDSKAGTLPNEFDFYFVLVIEGSFLKYYNTLHFASLN